LNAVDYSFLDFLKIGLTFKIGLVLRKLTESIVMDREHLCASRWQRRYQKYMPAIKGALDAGARYIEVDVQLSADGVPVLFHDRTLQRICRQRGTIDRYSADNYSNFPPTSRPASANNFSAQRFRR